jgi:hypothetical protein
MNDEWNVDYAVAFESLEGMAEEILERMEEEDFYTNLDKKDLAKIMKERKKAGCIELLATDDEAVNEFQELTGFMVQAVYLGK